MSKIISLNVGLPRDVFWRGRKVQTSIYKFPVSGKIHIRHLNLDGDRQSDLRVHGGPDKAVYAYPSEHYEFWKNELPTHVLNWGGFGENITTEGLFEPEVCIGGQYRAGSALLVVTQPRMPCFKLGIRFGSEKMIKRFLDSRRSGFYFSVLEEGEAEAGDEIKLVKKDPHRVSVLDIVRLYVGDHDPDLIEKALQVDALPEGWRTYFLKSR